MKMRSLLFGLLLLGASNANAQFPAANNNLFNCDVGLVVPYMTGTGSVGFGGYAEPKFNIHDMMAVGFKAEADLMFGGNFSDIDAGELSLGMFVVATQQLTFDFIPLKGNFRPVIGLGFGRYGYGGQSISTSSTIAVTQEAGVSWGLAPRLAVQFGAFRLSCEYNLLFKPSVYVTQDVSVGGPPMSKNLSRNYFGFKIGGVIGWRKAK